jgi:hypothetical protein
MNYKTKKKHKSPRRTRSRKQRKLKLVADPACWGKNKPLEQLWRDMSQFLSVVVIYKRPKPYEVIKMHHPTAVMRQLNDDPHVVAVLTSSPDIHNAYETLLYPKAKDKTVDYVITHYARFFKKAPHHKQYGNTPLHKLRIPY